MSEEINNKDQLINVLQNFQLSNENTQVYDISSKDNSLKKFIDATTHRMDSSSIGQVMD